VIEFGDLGRILIPPLPVFCQLKAMRFEPDGSTSRRFVCRPSTARFPFHSEDGLMRLLALFIALLFVPAVVSAQASMTVRVQWDPNTSADGVTTYTLTVDGGAPVSVPAASCTATLCEQSVSVPLGPHTFAVTATNAWGTSAATSVVQVVAPPLPPKNLRIVK
jgi:hypothetical protein